MTEYAYGFDPLDYAVWAVGLMYKHKYMTIDNMMLQPRKDTSDPDQLMSASHRPAHRVAPPCASLLSRPLRHAPI